MMKTAALCSAVAALVLVASAAVAAAQTARVLVSATSPFTVRGSGFRAHEHVTVTVSATVRRTKAVVAGARGGFKASFSAVKIGACEGYVVRAKGNRGSLAILKVMPECAPPGPSSQPDVLFPRDPPPKHR
jgi:hypothetical protein